MLPWGSDFTNWSTPQLLAAIKELDTADGREFFPKLNALAAAEADRRNLNNEEA